MFEPLRMILASGATGGAAIAAAVILVPVALEVLPIAPVDGPMVSAHAPSEGATVSLFEVTPHAPTSGPEVVEMTDGQSDGPVSLATRVIASLQSGSAKQKGRLD